MCPTCGRHLPHESHCKKDYLLFEDLEKSAAIEMAKKESATPTK